MKRYMLAVMLWALAVSGCTTGTTPQEICNTGIDEDKDGYVDCADADCAYYPSCTPTVHDEVCDSGLDEDGDGAVDCADADCFDTEACASELVCYADENYGVITPENQVLSWDYGFVGLEGQLNDGDKLIVELWEGYGAFRNRPIEPGVYNLAEDELSYETCGICIGLSTDDVDNPAYFATGGTVVIHEVGAGIRLDVVDVSFRHVDNNLDKTVDACTSHIDSASFLMEFSYEVCEGGVDEDNDGAIDCEDYDCFEDPACFVELVCYADENYGTVTPSNQEAYSYDSDTYYTANGGLNEEDFLLVELWEGYGALRFGIEPGVYDLTGDELSYDTCGICVLLITDDINNPIYFATGGTVIIYQLLPTLVAEFLEVSFEHVDPYYFEPLDACYSHVSNAIFDVAVDQQI